VIRRMLYRGRQRVRGWTRRALDRLDPPDAPEGPVEEPLRIVPEQTPNPLAVRYGVSRPVGMVDGHTALGRSLLGIPGVVSVYGTGDFVAVTRDADADQLTVDAAVRRVLTQAL